MGIAARALVWVVASVGVACAGSAPPPAGPPASPPVRPVVASASSDAAKLVAPIPRSRGRIGDCPKRGDSASFTLVHVNDLQARYSERIEGKSRYARISGLIKAALAEAPTTAPALVLSAGDDYEKGSLLDLRTEGAATRRIVHALPIDVRTLGNHDFAFGESAVREDVRTSPHPVVLANVTDPESADLFRPSLVIDVGCVKVGVFGLVTRPYGSDDEQFDGDYGAFSHEPRAIAVAERMVRKLRGEVDVVIALSHLGKLPDIHVAREVDGIDLVVGGHSEDALAKPARVTRTDGSVAYVVQAGRYGESVGKAELSVEFHTKKLDVDRYALLPVDASAPVDDALDELVTKLEGETLPELHLPVATLSRERSGRELVEILARAAARELSVDGVIVGRDAFWGSLPAGPITLDALYQTMFVQKQPIGGPGFTSLVTVEISQKSLARLRPRLRRASPFSLELTPSGGAGRGKKTLKLAVEKRVYDRPRLAFFGGASFGKAEPAGELIDVFERYARAQRARGAHLDEGL